MKIEAVDLFYLRMPEVLDIGDGSQDGLVFRVRAGNFEGWGEAVASPLTSIASWIAPMSHSGCHPVIDSVLGEELNSPSDIERIARKVKAISFYGIIQSDLTFSGVEIALWDLLGRTKTSIRLSLIWGFSRRDASKSNGDARIWLFSN